jgi:hypothetical protein
MNAREISKLSQVPEVWRDCLPYGGDGKTNCQDLLEQQLSAEGKPGG